jgi:hypothetical protein
LRRHLRRFFVRTTQRDQDSGKLRDFHAYYLRYAIYE